jgi:hypothetical protein
MIVLPLLLNWLTLLRQQPPFATPSLTHSITSPEYPNNSSPLLPHSLTPSLHTMSFNDVSSECVSEVVRYAPQVASFLLDGRTSASLLQPPSHTHSLTHSYSVSEYSRVEEMILRRCRGNFPLGFRLYCAVKVSLCYSILRIM